MMILYGVNKLKLCDFIILKLSQIPIKFTDKIADFFKICFCNFNLHLMRWGKGRIAKDQRHPLAIFLISISEIESYSTRYYFAQWIAVNLNIYW